MDLGKASNFLSEKISEHNTMSTSIKPLNRMFDWFSSSSQPSAQIFSVPQSSLRGDCL